MEANGTVYAYALDHGPAGGFTRVATVNSGFAGVMALEFDHELENFRVLCDDGCQGRSALLDVNASGRFVPTALRAAGRCPT